MIRVAITLAGAAVVGAAVHQNVIHAGGWGSADAPLIVTLAVLLALGMVGASLSWSDGRKLAAVALGVCVLAGETYWLLLNGEREIAARELAAAPTAEAARVRTAAEHRLAIAEAAAVRAEAAALSEAAKPGCAKNCAALMREAAARAAGEVSAARTALGALPRPVSAAPLPERLGVAPWAWDLVMAALRSLAVVGGSIAIGIALHPRGQSNPPIGGLISQPQPTTALVVSDNGSPRDHVARFLRHVIEPDPNGEASLRQVYGLYAAWCAAAGTVPLQTNTLGGELRAIVDALGLQCERSGDDVIVRGACVSGLRQAPRRQALGRMARTA